VSSLPLAYLDAVKKALVAKTVEGQPLAKWTVYDYIPSDQDVVEIGQTIMMDLAEEGEGIMTDGSGSGALVVILVAAPVAGGYTGARSLVADAVQDIRDALLIGAVCPDRVTVTYRPGGVLFQAPVFLASVELEKRLT